MRKWHNLYEPLSLIVKLVAFGCALTVIGQIITNPAFYSLYVIDSPIALMFGEGFLRIGQFLIIYSPLFMLFRLVISKNQAYRNISMGLVGYITFVVFSIFFSMNKLDSSAYNATLGISISNSTIAEFANRVNYPLISGIFGPIIIIVIVRFVSKRLRNTTSIGLFGNVDPDLRGLVYTVVLSIIASFAFSFVWTYAYEFLQSMITFVASDLNNPINLMSYGLLDRIGSLFSLSSLIRAPFWFGNAGGSITTIAGQAISGDVSIFSAVIADNLTISYAGRLITPYYVMNLIVIPISLIALYRINSDKMERKRTLFLLGVCMLLSVFGGGILPFELFLLIVSPFLYLFHLLMMAALFGILNTVGITLGFVGTSTITSIPGNIVEFVIYLANYRYRFTCIAILGVGLIVGIIYFAVISYYFKRRDIKTFGAELLPLAKGIISAFGGVENFKFVNASLTQCTVAVYDNTIIDPYALRKYGVNRIFEKRSGYGILLGANSYLVKKIIDAQIAAKIRNVSE